MGRTSGISGIERVSKEAPHLEDEGKILTAQSLIYGRIWRICQVHSGYPINRFHCGAPG